EGAVACRTGCDIERRVERKSDIGMIGSGGCLAPGPSALPVGKARTGRIRLAERSNFPFGFGRQAPLRPIAPGFRLIPIYNCHPPMGRELLDLAVASPSPAAALFREPIDRPFGASALAPLPASRAPEFRTAVSGVLDEGGELGIRHRRLGDAEWR